MPFQLSKVNFYLPTLKPQSNVAKVNRHLRLINIPPSKKNHAPISLLTGPPARKTRFAAYAPYPMPQAHTLLTGGVINLDSGPPEGTHTRSIKQSQNGSFLKALLRGFLA